MARRLRRIFVNEVRTLWAYAAVDHGSFGARGLRYRLIRALESYLLRPADYVTCIYEGLRQEIIGRGVASSRVTVNPNAVDIDRFAPGDVGSGRLVEAGSPFRVGFIGSFYRYEGLDLLIEAAALAELMRMAASDPELCTKTVKNGHESVCAKRKWSASVARY